jgi:uncharacterized protein (DUF2235 family)
MKHLISLVDGTWVSAPRKKYFGMYSNIYKLNLLLDHRSKNGDPQITFYTPGPGSRSGVWSQLNGGIGRGLGDLAEEVYVNIASNYEPGDKIYLFGFSRGAVVARFIAGFISKFGMMKAKYIGKFGHFVSSYVSNKNTDQPNDEVFENAAVEFIGVFDTVFASTPLSDRYLKNLVKSDLTLPKAVRHGLHLLAMDEQRRNYEPQLWAGFDGDTEGRSLEQIWMPGVHSDIGGLYSDTFLGEMALITMISRVDERTQLKFSADDEIFNPKSTAQAQFTVNGYDTLLANLLYYIGKDRRFDSKNPFQFLSPVAYYANKRSVKKKYGLRWRTIPVGKYRFINSSIAWASGFKLDQLNQLYTSATSSERQEIPLSGDTDAQPTVVREV